MPTNPAIDQYISKVQPFAQPVLIHLRKLVHQACPTVEENIKWGMPSFEYKGLMCGFAAFKQHCTFGFWKASLMSDPLLMENARAENAMGHLGRITSVKDLPSDKKILGYIKEAMKLNDEGIKVVKAKPVTKKNSLYPQKSLLLLRKTRKLLQPLKTSAQAIKETISTGLMKPKQQLPKRKE